MKEFCSFMLTPAKVVQIEEAYKTHGADISKLEEELNWSRKTVRTYLCELHPELNLTPPSKPKPKKSEKTGPLKRLNQEQINELIEVYNSEEGDFSKIKKIFDYSSSHNHSSYTAPTLRKYYDALGLELRLHDGNTYEGKGGRTKSQEEIKRIIDSYRRYDGDAYVASKQIGIGPQAIIKYWKLEGLEPITKEQRTRRDLEKLEILADEDF